MLIFKFSSHENFFILPPSSSPAHLGSHLWPPLPWAVDPTPSFLFKDLAPLLHPHFPATFLAKLVKGVFCIAVFSFFLPSPLLFSLLTKLNNNFYPVSSNISRFQVPIASSMSVYKYLICLKQDPKKLRLSLVDSSQAFFPTSSPRLLFIKVPGPSLYVGA